MLLNCVLADSPVNTVFINTSYVNTNSDQLYLTGFAEGYVCAQMILDFRSNYLLDQFNSSVPEHINAFNQKRLQFINENVYNQFTRAAKAVLSQLQGIADGVNAALKGDYLTVEDVFLINQLQSVSQIRAKSKKQNYFHRSSGIVLTDNTELYLAHSSAKSYTSGFNRIHKHIQLGYHTLDSTTRKTSLQFLGCPGIIHPIDGFIQIIGQDSQYIILQNQYDNFNEDLYAPGIYDETVFEQTSIIESYPAFMVVMGASMYTQSPIDFFSAQQNYSYLDQLSGYLMVDVDEFNRLKSDCPPSQQLLECYTQNYKISYIFERSYILDTTQQLLTSGLLLLTDPVNPEFTQVLKIPDEQFYAVNNSVRYNLLKYIYNEFIKDPINSLESLLMFNDNSEILNHDSREGFAPRYDIQNSDQQYGACNSQIFKLSDRYSKWIYLNVPKSTRKFSFAQLPNYNQMKGNLQLNEQWVFSGGCGPKNYNSRCDECINGFDITSRCQQCAKGYVEIEGKCLSEDDPKNNLGIVIAIYVVSMLVLAVVVALLVWMCCFLTKPKTEYKKMEDRDGYVSEEDQSLGTIGEVTVPE
ncbi:Phospholipase_B [Hexamita inflata]|uniref:Phospholipase B-like n=1 Tax=Hexamita inflata TaxID=28002 RepID=A0AA86RF44_9EUKA|nr:Phospholipase B [Hexamita inflata]